MFLHPYLWSFHVFKQKTAFQNLGDIKHHYTYSQVRPYSFEYLTEIPLVILRCKMTIHLHKMCCSYLMDSSYGYKPFNRKLGIGGVACLTWA